ncbi:MAG: oxidoreductase [bacterium]|nr:oxidoreductase [bacterium]
MGRRKWGAGDVPNLAGRVAVVTGASSGLGLETALQLARRGAVVVMACRDLGRGAVAAAAIGARGGRAHVEVAALDLGDLESVREFADWFCGRFERLDLLVNNAGVMMPPASKTVDGFELQFGTNHLGHFALTVRLLGLLRASAGSRVVTVSSLAHRIGVIRFDDLQWESRPYRAAAAYAQSKLANLLFCFELQSRIDSAGTEMLSVASHPGYSRTGILRHSTTLRIWNPLFAMPASQGALPTLFAATSPDAEPGGYYGPNRWGQLRGYPTRVNPSAAAQDRETARRLWQASEELTGLQCLLE